MVEKKLGQRRTSQRQAILRVIVDVGRPLTVGEIHQAALSTSKNLGLATVYRTLKLLIAAEEIRVVNLPNAEVRYEAFALSHHHHFHCRSCNDVFDLEVCPVSVPEGTTFPNGFRVEDHHVTLYGVCAGCNGAPSPARS